MNNLNQLKGLYTISNGTDLPQLIDKVQMSLRAGTTVFQYRSKTKNHPTCLEESLVLFELCQQFGVPFIVNDDIKLANEIGANGVHLGQDDCSLAEARSLLGNECIIGVSCYNQLELAIQAEQEGANYVAFGSMFASPTKPNAPQASIGLLKEAKKQLSIPICCIGGITTENAGQLIDAGADMIAVISAIYSSKDIEKATYNFTKLFDNE